MVPWAVMIPVLIPLLVPGFRWKTGMPKGQQGAEMNRKSAPQPEHVWVRSYVRSLRFILNLTLF
jgi:hypothetical protein